MDGKVSTLSTSKYGPKIEPGANFGRAPVVAAAKDEGSSNEAVRGDTAGASDPRALVTSRRFTHMAHSLGSAVNAIAKTKFAFAHLTLTLG